MRKNYILKAFVLIFLFTGLVHFQARAQFDLKIEQCADSLAVVDLIKDVFLDGVSPSQYKNVSFKGNPSAVGYFYSGYVFGFSRPQGIVMSSGRAGDQDQSNTCSGFLSGATNGGSDPDLVQAGGSSINDACVIEFDFKPSGDSVKFNFSFGSEEYHEWVSPLFADVFGFFLSGPGINGPYSNNAVNIAEIPGSNQAVSIGTLNCGDQDAACQPPPGSGPNCYLLIDNGDQSANSFDQFALDAYTVPMEADNMVQSCKWYHIKLAIGDAGDNAYDTGVFLEKGSFDPGNVFDETEFTHPTIDTLLYESCNNHEAIIHFEIGSVRASDYKIPFRVEGTATRNVDYQLITTHPGDTIVIEAGERQDSIQIRTFYDTEVEGIEDVQIIFNSVMCGFGTPDTAFVQISDLPTMVDTSLTFETACEDVVTLGFGNLMGGVAPYSYDWYTIGKKTATVQYNPSGDDYFVLPVVIKDTCGQSVSDTAIVVVPDLVADAGPDKSMCNQDSVQLEGSSPGAQHFWWTSNPADPSLAGKQDSVQPWVYPTVETNYILEVSDNCTNLDTDTVFVTLSEAVADAGEDENICINGSVTLSANGGAGFTWLWSSAPPDPTLPGQENNQTITVTPTATTTYTVVVTNECDFSASDNVVVDVIPLPNANAGPDDEICFGESYQLSASGATHYQWSSIPYDATLYINGQDTMPNPIVTPSTQEPYVYSVEVWDQCLNTDEMTLAVNPTPNISVSADQNILCYGESVTIQAVGDADYTWTSDPVDPTLAGQENNQTITVTPLVPTTYTLEGVVSGFDCPASVSQFVDVKPQLVADFDMQDNITCEGEPFSVIYMGNAAPDATYSWDFSGGVIENGSGPGPIDVKWDSAGDKVITLLVTEDGCASEPFSATVTVISTPEVSFSAPVTEGCVPLEVNFTNNSQDMTDNVSFLWDFGNGDDSQAESPTYTFTEPGTYDVMLTVTNESRCFDSYTESSYINVYEIPEADFTLTPEETILEEATISFTNGSTSDDPMTFYWDFGDSNNSSEEDPLHTYTSAGTYTVTLVTTTTNGCENTAEKEVLIHPDFAVYAPNAFTPNDDGLNDVFEVKGLGIKHYNLKVYSRWGELIYESENLEDQWDGTFNGEMVPAGTYVYKISYSSLIDKDYDIEGTVTVMR